MTRWRMSSYGIVTCFVSVNDVVEYTHVTLYGLHWYMPIGALRMNWILLFPSLGRERGPFRTQVHQRR